MSCKDKPATNCIKKNIDLFLKQFETKYPAEGIEQAFDKIYV